MVKASDCRLYKGRGFDSRPLRFQETTLDEFFSHMHVCLHPSMYDFVPVPRQWCPTAGKVTACPHHTLQTYYTCKWLIDLRAEGPGKRNQQPAYISLSHQGTLLLLAILTVTGGEVASGWLGAASRLARISLTIPDGVTDLAGVPVLLPGVVVVVVVVVGLENDEFSKSARVAANVGSFFTLPTESLSAEPPASLCNVYLYLYLYLFTATSKWFLPFVGLSSRDYYYFLLLFFLLIVLLCFASIINSIIIVGMAERDHIIGLFGLTYNVCRPIMQTTGAVI